MTRSAAIAIPLSFVLGASSSVSAQQTPAAGTAASDHAAQPATDGKAYDPNKVICKSHEVAGSRIGATRVCHTRADWDEMERHTQDVVRGAEAGAYQMTPH